MNSKDIRIVYMGTPDFAVESLKKLVEGGYNVVGVVTMPDKPAGRGQKIKYSAVKEYALSKGLYIMQPERLKDESFLAELASLNADLQIVVAFRMLPESVWNMPPLGTFNLHASLLPQYRGAAPINWAIMNGDKESGVTTFFLTHEIDTGNIIMQERVAIGDDDCAGTLHDNLMYVGADMVCKTVDAIAEGNITTKEQPMDIELKAAPKIFKNDCKIDWSESAEKIRNKVRGLSPYPTAWGALDLGNGEEPLAVKIFSVDIIEENGKTGTIKTDGKHFIEVYCGDGALRISSLQLPGKKRLTVEELLRGYSFNEYCKFV
ncbi:MAG: methionyl-tRNA formyltransferase [Bacteroidales bacterium]|nr:methionyl-tRNA formyltransferase [Bacteroidales bacterium]